MVDVKCIDFWIVLKGYIDKIVDIKQEVVLDILCFT